MENGNGQKMVTARSAAGISLASVASAIALIILIWTSLGLPTLTSYKQDQSDLRQQIMELQGTINGIDRRLKAFGFTDEEIERRLREVHPPTGRLGRSR